MTETAEKIMLPAKWKLPKKWAEWALEYRKEWTLEHVKETAKRFHLYHSDKKSTRDNADEWEIAWHAWVQRQRTDNLRIKPVDGWWNSASGIESKGRELGIQQADGEPFPYLKERIFLAAGNGPWRKL